MVVNGAEVIHAADRGNELNIVQKIYQRQW